uniref:Uncharacterized protein n=1 Tax=Anguilla anguilla TaxID=7936 RepID=A0A0E9S3B1_ANGAN
MLFYSFLNILQSRFHKLHLCLFFVPIRKFYVGR